MTLIIIKFKNVAKENYEDMVKKYSEDGSLAINNKPLDIAGFTGNWVTIPKDDPVRGTNAWVPFWDEAVYKDLKLIFKDWLYIDNPHFNESTFDISSTKQINGREAIINKESYKTEMSPNDSFRLDKNCFLVAVWYSDLNLNKQPDELETKYTIKYVAGTGDNVTNLAPDQINILSGLEETVVEAVPYREGWSFTGWQCSIDNQIYKAGQTFTMPEDNVVFTATWAKTTYLLSYLDKDSNLITAYNYAFGQNVTLLKLPDLGNVITGTTENPIKSYYRFAGWKDLSTGQVYSSSYIMPDKNVTLQAYYDIIPGQDGEEPEVPKVYYVTYDADTTDTVIDIPVDLKPYKKNEVVIVSYTIPTRKGYRLKGWNYNGTTYKPGEHFSMPEGNVTLKALWEEDSSQQGPGESDDPSSTTIKMGQYPQTANFDPEVIIDDITTYPFDTNHEVRTIGVIVTPNPVGTYREGKVNGYYVDTITPSVTIKDEASNQSLTEGIDYEIEYVYDPYAQIAPEEATVVNGWIKIIGKGKYSNGIVLPFIYQKPDSEILYAQNIPSADPKDQSTYPEYGKEIKSYVLHLYKEGIYPSTVLGTYDPDPETGLVTIGDFKVYYENPDGNGQDLEKYWCNEGEHYSYEYVDNIKGKDIGYLIIYGKGIFGGSVIYPFKINNTETPTKPDDGQIDNPYVEKSWITGNAKDNLKNINASTYITFDTSNFDGKVNSYGIGTGSGIDQGTSKSMASLPMFIEDRVKVDSALQFSDTSESIARDQAMEFGDYFKMKNNFMEKSPTQGKRFSVLGLFGTKTSDSIIKNLNLHLSLRESIKNKGLMTVDIAPILREDAYDHYLSDKDKVMIYYNADYFEPDDKILVGSLDLSKLEYNRVNEDGVNYMVAGWQSVVCDLSNCPESSEPTLYFEIAAPNNSIFKTTEHGFYIGLDNLRFGGNDNPGQEPPSEGESSSEETTEESGGEDSTQPSKGGVISQDGLDIKNPDTYPKDPTKTVTINGIVIAPNPIGTTSESEPTVSVSDAITNEILIKDEDYTITYLNNDKDGLAYVVISGVNKYSGLALIPFNLDTSKPDAIIVGVEGYTINANDINSFPKDTTAVLSTYGFKFSQNTLGTQSTRYPTIEVYDKTTNTKLTKDIDYTESFYIKSAGTTTNPYFMIIQGISKYKGTVVFPYAYKASSSSGGSSGGGGSALKASTYTVTLKLGEHAIYAEKSQRKTFSVYKGNSITLPKIIPDDGYKFIGWSLNEKGTKLLDIDDDNKYIPEKTATLYGIVLGNDESIPQQDPEEENKDKPKRDPLKENVSIHKGFINGYNDGTFRPSNNITRGETATILTSVLELQNGSNSFLDVEDAAWYADSIKAVASAGIVSGYSDGTFKPTGYITRAEFVTMIARAKNLNDTECKFSDIDKHWAYNYICGVASQGWIAGYNNGTFKPDEPITRAEVVVIIDRMLGRSPDTGYIQNKISSQPFTDVAQDFWGYNYILEASITHYVDNNKSTETWIGHD